MSKKVKQEVVKKLNDTTEVAQFISPDYYKRLVVLNVYDKFWGMVEVADPVIKRFIDISPNANKVDFVAAETEMIDPEITKKYKIQSKPVYLLFYVRMNIISI